MSDIFISYARPDRSKAQILARALEHRGWSVWWDPDIRIGGKFDEAIKKELDAAKCVIVLWSSSSIISEWVKDEATEAVKRGVLVPALIEDVEIPFGFGLRRIQAAWLVDWHGSLDQAEFVRLLKDLSARIEAPGEISIIQQTPAKALLSADIGPSKHYITRALVILAAFVIAGIIFAVYRLETDSKSASVAQTTSAKPEAVAPQKLYSEMTEDERLDLVRQQAQRVSSMLGERSIPLSDKAVRSIKVSVDSYAARINSLSEEQWKEGLHSVFGRASQYAPVIVRSFKGRGVPPIVGLYIPMIESEYRACLVNGFGSVGMYQFLPETGRDYGVSRKNLCNIEKIAPAAADYIADRMVEFGADSMSMTLVLVSFNRSPDSIRRDLRLLRRDNPNIERSFWTLFDNADKLDVFFRTENVNYVPKFFAAAIVGENPESFGVTMRPLSTQY